MADCMEEDNKKMVTLLSSLPSSPTLSYDSDPEDNDNHAPLSPWSKQRRRARKRAFFKQLSMREAGASPRDVAWEKRRRQIMRQERKGDGITDEDLNELKGSIELGFGFKEEAEGLRLCHTLPALDLYFAVNRQVTMSPVSTPKSSGGSTSSTPASSIGRRSSSFDSPGNDSETWKICSPGDNPKLVKNKLRLWAQAVACSVKQSFRA